MTKHPIPDEVLVDHIAVLGKTGSGKTYAAKGIVERLLDQKRRVCIIDPTDVWWGLKSSADGKSEGYPVVIFGGKHADVPLLATHGKVLAETISTTDMACIVCVRHFTNTDRIRFLTDLLESLCAKNEEPLHFIIDEAHRLAPQKPLGDMQRLTHWTGELVTGGRAAGFRVMMLSQRPARLNKDVLTQCEALVAMRLIGPQDRDAVKAWIADQADEVQGKEIIASLPKLANGEAWLWAPEKDILKRIHFPLIRTYDSSKTKRDGKADAGAKLASVDLSAIQDRLGKVKSEIEANDPKALKARVAELEKQLRAKGATVVADPKAADQAYKSSYDTGQMHGMSKGASAANAAWMKWRKDLMATLHKMEALAPMIVNAISFISMPPVMPDGPANGQAPARLTTTPPLSEMKPATQRAIVTMAKAVAQQINGSIPARQMRVLNGVAWWIAAGNEQPTRAQVAGAAGYAPGNGNFNNLVGALKTAGLIDYPTPGTIRLTDEGRAMADIPGAVTTEDLHAKVADIIESRHKKIFDAVIAAYPESLTREEVAEQSGYQAGNGNFNNLVGRLSTLELITYPRPGAVRAADWLFLS